MMGLGQGSRGAPPSWIQLSLVLVNIFRKIGHRGEVHYPLTQDVIHTLGTLFVHGTDLYMWKEGLMDTKNHLWEEVQEETLMWGNLLCVTGAALKAEKCF